MTKVRYPTINKPLQNITLKDNQALESNSAI
jgi:hypothetical protein